ncbi:MAG: dihydrodipicolinate reductase C-terminal domain-containing protein [Ornithinimicrobium sp.]
MPRTVGLFGRGRLGSLVASAIEASPDLECAWQLGHGEQAPSDVEVDVAIDVSHRDAVADHVTWANETATDLVIGATGWPPESLRNSGRFSGVLIAPNFSLSIALVRRFAVVLGGYADRYPGPVDLAVTETHHRAKVDSPSGTATLLAAALATSAGRPTADIALSSLRLGAVVGTHDVRFESASESITVRHEAHSREVFAEGALAAARWIHRRRGVFTVDDWAADQLDGLFTTQSTRLPVPDRSIPASPAQEHS